MKGIAVILVVALSLAGLSGCAALDAAHMAWQGMVILGDIKIPQSSAPKQQAVKNSDPAVPEETAESKGDSHGNNT